VPLSPKSYVELARIDAVQTTFAALFLLFLIGYLLWALSQYRLRHDTTGLFVIAGGLISGIFEPIAMTMGKCRYPVEGQFPTFTLLQQSIPIYVPLGYVAMLAGTTMIVLAAIRKGTLNLLPTYFILIAITTPFDILAIKLGLYSYYGTQPLMVFGYPAWWPAVNLAIPVLVATVITLLPSGMSTMKRGIAVAMIVPITVGAMNGGAAWPAWLVNGSPNVHPALIQGAGLLVWVFGISVVLGCSAVLHRFQVIAVYSVPMLPGNEPFAAPGTRENDGPA
jgi:hypothetical protein